MKRIVVFLLAIMTALLMVAGCGTENASQGKQSDTRVVKDIEGTEVTIPKDITKVADLWHANNQVVLMLGGADTLVSTTKNVQGLPWFAKVYPRIKEIPAPVKGIDVQMEEIQKLKPQVVLASNKNQIEMARNAGIPAVRVNFADYDGLRKTITITADVLGGDAPDMAKQYITYLDGKIKFAEEKTKNISDADRPSVLHIVGGDDLLKVDGHKTIIDEWIRYAGGKNAITADGPQITVTMEEIVKANPDIIIIGGTQSRKGIEQLMNDPQWSSLKAVQNGRVYSNPVGTFNWDRYSAESALQILWAGQIIQPQLFSDVNLVKETQDFYKTFLHYDLSDVEAQRIIAGEGPQ